MKTYHLSHLITLAALCLFTTSARSEVRMPSIFGNNMVLQRNQPNPVWGWADPKESVTITIHEQTVKTQAGDDGSWRVSLEALPTGGPYEMTIRGKNTLEFDNILSGEVWICSGQSNMQWSVNASNDPDLEKLTANYPQIRLVSVPRVGTQVPMDDFEGQWEECSPKTVGNFSAVGYFFGRQLHNTLNVPIGLINNAWGSAAEAWVRRDILEADPRYAPLLERWKKTEADAKLKTQIAAYEKAMKDWKWEAIEARAKGEPTPKDLIAPTISCLGTIVHQTSIMGFCTQRSDTESKEPFGIKVKATLQELISIGIYSH